MSVSYPWPLWRHSTTGAHWRTLCQCCHQSHWSNYVPPTSAVPKIMIIVHDLENVQVKMCKHNCHPWEVIRNHFSLWKKTERAAKRESLGESQFVCKKYTFMQRKSKLCSTSDHFTLYNILNSSHAHFCSKQWNGQCITLLYIFL